MSDPYPDRRVAVTNAHDLRDPIAVAFAALTAPEHQDQTGSHPRATWNTSPTGGRVDPLAVMRDALAADDEEQDIADEATRPGLFSRLTDRTRSGASRRRSQAARGEEPLVAPEVEAATADSPATEATPDTSPADEGWVHHDGSDATGHEGWLYHYADGTIVDADGTVYEYAATPADEASSQVEPAEPAPGPEPASEEDRHDDADLVAEAEVADEAEPGPEAKAEDEPVPDPEPEPVAIDAAPEPTAAEEEPAEVDPQPVAMLTGDEEPSAHAEPEREPEPEPVPTEVDPEPIAMLAPDTEQDTEDQTDAHADADADTSPDSDATAAPGAEPTHDAESDGRPETDAAHETETDHPAERGQKAVPAFVEYSSGDAPRYVAGAVLLVASVVAVLVLVSAIADRSGSALFVAVLLGVLAAGASWFLTRWEPTVVTLRDGRLEVTRGDDGDYFDLRDPATEVHLDGNPGSPTWRARFSEPEGSRATLRRTQVKARQFVDIVEHHRAQSERADQWDAE